MKLVKVQLLNPIEDFSPVRVDNMMKKMVKAGVWKRPICIEKNNFLVLDGHHRFEVAKKMNLKYIPCAFFEYEDPNLTIYSLREEEEVHKELVIKRGTEGDIYPYKTVKHVFPSKVKDINMLISEIAYYSYNHDDDIIDEFEDKDKYLKELKEKFY